MEGGKHCYAFGFRSSEMPELRRPHHAPDARRAAQEPAGQRGRAISGERPSLAHQSKPNCQIKSRLLQLMRPRIVRSPSTFASAPGRAMQRSHALGQRQRHYQSPPFIALAMIGPTPGTVINCRSMVELYERRGVRFPGSQWS